MSLIENYIGIFAPRAHTSHQYACDSFLPLFLTDSILVNYLVTLHLCAL